MRYQAVVVADHELPPGVDRVLVERADDEPPLYLIRASVCPPMIMWNESKEARAAS